MGKINLRRSTILIAALLFAFISAWSGSWKKATEYHDLVRRFQFRIVAEEYAEKQGTTIEEINRQFVENDQRRYRQERDSGLPECAFLFTKGKSCARPPITSGGPLIGFPKGTVAELLEANRRSMPSLIPLLLDFLKAIVVSVLICLAAPIATLKIWRWLQGGSGHVS
jgi:hypothetical protein